MTRQVAWMQQQGRARFSPEMKFADLGIVKVSGPPAYDNGSFFVIDSVRELVWDICWADDAGVIRCIRRVELDKYEAIRIADELKESEGRQ